MHKLLDLFSGIGGFSLGLERTGGFETVAFCEIEEFPRRVLKKHWPKVPCYDDIRTLTAARLAADGITVDAICGGFPCQDISTAGKGAGIDGERSGLWVEYARLIGELRPRVVFVENVAALLGRGLGRVLGDLAAIGYDAEWHCIPASAVGAPHRRDRLWIVANPRVGRCGQPQAGQVQQQGRTEAVRASDVANANGQRRNRGGQRTAEAGRDEPSHRSKAMADTACQRRGEAREHSERSAQRPSGGSEVSNAGSERPQGPGRPLHSIGPASRLHREIYRAFDDSRWAAEPAVGRVANGVPDRVDRLKGLGNAVVPQIPELLGNAWLASLEAAA